MILPSGMNGADGGSLFIYGKLSPGKLAKNRGCQHQGYKVIADACGVTEVYYKRYRKVYV